MLLGEATGCRATEATTGLRAPGTAWAALFLTTLDLPGAGVVGSHALGLREVFLGDARPTLDHGVRQLAEQQLHGAHGVVVAGDGDVRLVRVTVGIEDADDGHVHARRLPDRDVFTARVDHHDRARHAVQVADALEVAADLAHLPAHRRLVLFLVVLDGAVRLETFELFQPLQPLANRVEVGQRAADPALRHGGHSAPRGLGFDHDAQLPLGPEEHDLRSRARQLPEEVTRPKNPADRLLQVDDVDLVPLAEDVRFHLRIPPAGLVSEVDSCVDQFLDGN